MVSIDTDGHRRRGRRPLEVDESDDRTVRSPRRRAVLGGLAASVGSVAGCLSAGKRPASEAASNDESTAELVAAATTALGTDSLFHATTETTALGVPLAGVPIAGARDAPVDLYYWGDYQCPFCTHFERGAFPELLANDVADGTVRIALLQLPKVGDDSKVAAALSKCVWRQVQEDRPDAYLRWHEAVFDAQGEKNSGWASRAALLSLTEDVDGIDADALEADLETNREKIRSRLDADAESATANGVSATPSFLVFHADSDTTTQLKGAQPYEMYRDAIEEVQHA
ncbi:DsbA family protein [Natribaculum luteum]|uniref:DsbA family protein n=1 Tax=Natribaculum luteum TaxID=1586232 RepID=A0ABD5P3W4_9EURY|nr:DsbA family protein [Natribaculum luteum]